MKIVMFTNTFTPHIGGVARSVSGLVEGLKELGHEVLVVAPEFDGTPAGETGVLRMPAIQRFAGSDFSAPVPVSRKLVETLSIFEPDIVHSHHPFLLGDTALRVAAARGLPVVFTYHTRYELYSHYVAQDSPSLQRLVLSVALGYCALCDNVIAPSQSIANFLSDHDINVPITVIPTGIDASRFDRGNGRRLRAELAIPDASFVIGHVGRLAKEKNLDYLAGAVSRFLAGHVRARLIVAGQGDMMETMNQIFAAAGVDDRVHFLGAVEGDRLADTYAAMDVFAFSSCSETQGLVLAEAMTAGVPVVALDAPGAREIVRDGKNGCLLPEKASQEQFCAALESIARLSVEARETLRSGGRETAQLYSRPESVARTAAVYASLLAILPREEETDNSIWSAARRGLSTERHLLQNIIHAVGEAIAPDEV